MLERVTVTASDHAASRSFYETVLSALTADPWACLALRGAGGAAADPRAAHRVRRPLPRRGGRLLAPRSRGRIPQRRRAGHRPHYHPDYCGGFLLDPDGNSAEAIHRWPRTESGPPVDHLWLGVADLGPSRRFWEAAGGAAAERAVVLLGSDGWSTARGDGPAV